MSDYRFKLIDRDLREPRRAEVAEQLRARPVARQAGELAATCDRYRPSRELEIAMNAAIAIGAPLLLTGEPGTGKTQAAYYAAWQLGLGTPLHFQAKTSSTATDLLYDFDTVRYFRDAYAENLTGTGGRSASDGASRATKTKLDKRDYIDPRPLWQAFITAEETGKPAVLLIDEIDKAPRDFPNDLLHEVQEMRFRIKETNEEVSCRPELRPLLFITSNDERRLPDAFLRRCVSHHIELTDPLLREAIEAHRSRFPRLGPDFIKLAVTKFMDLRGRCREKPPATGELLAWLQVLAIETGGELSAIDREPSRLPHLQVLLKTPEDRDAVGRASS